MLVLDTSTLPPSERAAAFQSAISGNASTSVATFEDPTSVQATLHAVDLGPGRVFNVEASANMLRRTPTMAARDENGAIALALPLFGRNLFRWAREEQVVEARGMLLVDLEAPYDYGWSGSGSSYAFQVDRDRLGVEMDLVRRAAPRLPGSPLFSLVRDHLLRVTVEAEQLAGSPNAGALGMLTVELMRALIGSAADDRRLVNKTRPTVLAVEILDYAQRHLAEPELTAARIAAVHHISLRYLYRLLELSGVRLEEWITAQRLTAARAALAASGGRHRTIAAVARSYGFTNASFFSARFRRAYGMTPREWRASQLNRP